MFLSPFVGAAILSCGSQAPEIPFGSVTRETIVSTVQTNGAIRPVNWTAVRARQAGAVARVLVEQGQTVTRGQLLAEMDTGSARGELASAQARIAEAKSELEVLDRGGRETQQVAIENDLNAERLELELAREEAASLERLVAKQAATRQELDRARERVKRAEVQIASLERKLGALVSTADRTAVKARLAAAEADADEARRRLSLGELRSPLAGTVYSLSVRPGAYLQPGDAVAEIGELDRLRAVIFVDEPELGRVEVGMPVKITWDALPGREWTGVVDRAPTEVVPLGTRQVGEVIGIIDNPEASLPPGANVNVEIRSRVSENALTIPKEALRREGGEVGVYALEGEQLRWRPVTVGTSSVTRAEVVSGLSEGDSVVLPTDVELRDGMMVRRRIDPAS